MKKLFKRIAPLLLALVMVLGSCLTVSAAKQILRGTIIIMLRLIRGNLNILIIMFMIGVLFILLFSLLPLCYLLKIIVVYYLPASQN